MADISSAGGWPPLKEEMRDANGNNTFAMADGFSINELGGLDGNSCHCCFDIRLGYGTLLVGPALLLFKCPMSTIL